MTGSQSIAVTTTFGLVLVFVPAAWADHVSDACAALANARTALYSMTLAKDSPRKMRSMQRCKRQAPSLTPCLPA
jgi:hypothetical protein